MKGVIAQLDTVRSLQIFNLLKFSLAILIRILLAKTNLTAAQIGVYDTLLFIGATFTFFWLSGLLDGLLSAYHRFNPDQQPVFLFNAALVLVALSLAIAAGLWSAKGWIVPLLSSYTAAEIPYYNWLCVYLAFNTPTFLIEYFYLLKDKPLHIIAFGIYSFGGQLLVVVLPIWLGYDLEYSWIGMVILSLTKYLWLVLSLRQFTQFRLKIATLTAYFSIALPLVLYLFIGGIMDYIDKALVSNFFGTAGLAIYESGAREFPLALALVGGISSALIPVIATGLDEGLLQIRQRTEKIMTLLFLLSVALMLGSHTLFPFVFNPEFAASANIFNLYLLILISRILLPQTILIGLKKTKIILQVSIIEILINFSLSLILLPFMGLEGIALATVIANWTEKILLISYNYFYLNIPLYRYAPIRIYFFYSALLLLTFGVSVYFFSS